MKNQMNEKVNECKNIRVTCKTKEVMTTCQFFFLICLFLVNSREVIPLFLLNKMDEVIIWQK